MDRTREGPPVTARGTLFNQRMQRRTRDGERREGAPRIVRCPAVRRIDARQSGGIHVRSKCGWACQKRGARARRIRGWFWMAGRVRRAEEGRLYRVNRPEPDDLVGR